MAEVRDGENFLKVSLKPASENFPLLKNVLRLSCDSYEKFSCDMYVDMILMLLLKKHCHIYIQKITSKAEFSFSS